MTDCEGKRLAIRWILGSGRRAQARKTAKRKRGQAFENKRFREIPDSVARMITEAYDLRREAFYFAWRNEAQRAGDATADARSPSWRTAQKESPKMRASVEKVARKRI